MSTVPNAIPGRDSIEVEIFGMEGIPEEDRLAHERTKTGKLKSHLFGIFANSLALHTDIIIICLPCSRAYSPICICVCT